MKKTVARFTQARASITLLMIAAALAAGGAARPAHAGIDGKCWRQWQTALVTSAIGKKCNFTDAATADALAKAEAARLQCAEAKATAAEKAKLQTQVAQVQAKATQRAAQLQCSEVKSSYDTSVANLTK
jgi:hypothetical protein